MEIKIKKSEKKVPKIERIQYNDSMALGKASRRKDRKSPGRSKQQEEVQGGKPRCTPKIKKGGTMKNV